MSTIDIQSNLSTAKFRQRVLEGLANGLTINGLTTPIPVILQASDASGYGLFHHAQSAASTNATLVKAAPTSVGLITVFHVGNGNRNTFLKIYNKASAPTSSNVPILTMVVHPSNTVVVVPAIPLYLDKGLGYRMTANYADSDNTAISEGELAINIAYA
jgi:hypothetical protein